MRLRVLFFVLIALVGGPWSLSFAQVASPAIDGAWVGAIQVPGGTLNIRVVFTTAAAGSSATIDIPQQGARGIPLRAVTRQGDVLRMELPSPVATAVFEGRIEVEKIAGTFTQGNASGTFSLARSTEVIPARVPPPYREEEVSVANGVVKLAGTLTLPEGRGPFPAVVLISGSGATTRDEDIFGFQVFREIADHFTRHGIAVYRYDDRGVGGSTGNVASATSADFAGDALAAVAQLKLRPDIDNNRIGLLGHSEGAMVAAIAAGRSSDPAFAILLAGPGVRGDHVLRRQAADVAAAQGAADEDIVKIVAAHQKVTDAVRSNAPLADVESAVGGLIGAQYNGIPALQQAAVGDRGALVARMVGPTAAQLTSRWMRFILNFDPAPALALVKIPVFALFGTLDTQVPPSTNEAPVRAALAGNANATVKVYEGANHLFQKARTGLVTEYAALEKSFIPGLLDELSSWILKIPGR